MADAVGYDATTNEKLEAGADLGEGEPLAEHLLGVLAEGRLGARRQQHGPEDPVPGLAQELRLGDGPALYR